MRLADGVPNSDRAGAPARLGIGLAASIALHLVVLSCSGPIAFRLWRQGAAAMPPQPLSVTLAAPVATGKARQSAEKPATPLAVPPTAADFPALPPTEQATPPTPPLAARSGPIPGPWYFPARLLHVLPTPLHPIFPIYPEEAREVRGMVRLVLLLNEQGGVDDYRVAAAAPPGVFERPVIDAFAGARYSPGFITGYAVRSEYVVEVTFEPGEPPAIAVAAPGGGALAAPLPVGPRADPAATGR